MPKVYNLLSHDVAEYIEKYIEDHQLGPGDKLPTERDLSARLNVTRTTIRLGLQRLIDQGLIYNLRNNGYFVCEAKISRQLISYCFPYSDPLLDKTLYSVRAVDYMADTVHNICYNLLDAEPDSHLIINKFIEYMNGIPVSLTYTMQKSEFISQYPGLFQLKELPEELVQKQTLRIYDPSETESSLLGLKETDSLLLISNCICSGNDSIAVNLSICVGTRTNLVSSIYTDPSSPLAGHFRLHSEGY